MASSRALVLLIHALRPEDPTVRDSPQFARALDIWVPVVLTRTRSPRAVKRFVNRVRYYAMCEAPPEPAPAWRQRIAGLLRQARRSSATAAAPRLPEELLVALGAIHESRPEFLAKGDALDPQMVQGDRLPGWADGPAGAAIEEHAKAFGGFSPEASDIDLFRRLAAGVTVR